MLNFLQICVIATLAGLIQGRSEAELKAWFLKLGVECAQDYPVTAEEMQAMHNQILPKTENAKCLLACVYRKATWMDSNGMLDEKTVDAMMEKDAIDDPVRLENSKKLFEVCAKINGEAVSDGNKGCDRAGLLYTCLTTNAPKYGFKI